MFNYQQVLFDVTVHYHTCFWKHSLPPRYFRMVDNLPKDLIAPTDETLTTTFFVCMVRMPYFWIRSTLRLPYGMIRFQGDRGRLGNDIRCEIEFDGRRFENIVTLWNEYYRAYARHLAAAAPAIFVRLEDLVGTPERVLRSLQQRLPLKPDADFGPAIETISNKPAKIHGEPCVYGEEARRAYVAERVPDHFEPADLDHINRHLDPELMSDFDYPFVS